MYLWTTSAFSSFLSTCYETAPDRDKETEALLPSYSNPRQKEGTRFIKTEFLIRQTKFSPETLTMLLWSLDKHPVLTRALLVDTWDHFRHTSSTTVAYHSSPQLFKGKILLLCVLRKMSKISPQRQAWKTRRQAPKHPTTSACRAV